MVPKKNSLGEPISDSLKQSQTPSGILRQPQASSDSLRQSQASSSSSSKRKLGIRQNGRKGRAGRIGGERQGRVRKAQDKSKSHPFLSGSDFRTRYEKLRSIKFTNQNVAIHFETIPSEYSKIITVSSANSILSCFFIR
jgi:hypothetical protein